MLWGLYEIKFSLAPLNNMSEFSDTYITGFRVPKSNSQRVTMKAMFRSPKPKSILIFRQILLFFIFFFFFFFFFFSQNAQLIFFFYCLVCLSFNVRFPSKSEKLIGSWNLIVCFEYIYYTYSK